MPTPHHTGAITFTTATEYERWLAAHHDSAAEVWLKIAKKNAPTPTITITEALDVALCYGWIDSHRRRLDTDHYLQRYSPRRRKSPWSQINRDKADALITAGRMREPGYAAIAAARTDGRLPGRTATADRMIDEEAHRARRLHLDPTHPKPP